MLASSCEALEVDSVGRELTTVESMACCADTTPPELPVLGAACMALSALVYCSVRFSELAAKPEAAVTPFRAGLPASAITACDGKGLAICAAKLAAANSAA